MFAVVTDDVRNFAQRPAQAAKDTASLIEESLERGWNKVKGIVEEVGSACRTDIMPNSEIFASRRRTGRRSYARAVG